MADVRRLQRKCAALQRACEDVTKMNACLMDKLRRSRRLIARMEREREFLLLKANFHASMPLPSSGGLRTYLAELVSGDALTKAGVPLDTSAADVDGDTVRMAEGVAAPPFPGARAFQSRPSSGRESADAPKRPCNAFIMFCNDTRGSAHEALEAATATGEQTDLRRIFSNKWKTLSADARQRYFDQYEREKERYDKERRASAAGGEDAPR